MESGQTGRVPSNVSFRRLRQAITMQQVFNLRAKLEKNSMLMTDLFVGQWLNNNQLLVGATCMILTLM